MDIQLSKENIKPSCFKDRMCAKLAILLSYPLTKLSPKSIEKVLGLLSKNKSFATYDEIDNARNAICVVSNKCRNQDRCIKRSLATFVMIILQGKKCSWCTGYTMDPFRAHAWVEIGHVPVGEVDEITRYEKVIKTEDKEYCQDMEQKKSSVSGFESYKEAHKQKVRLKDLFELISNKKRDFVIILMLGIISSVLTLLQPNIVSKIISSKGFNFFYNRDLYVLILIIIMSTILTTVQYYILQKISEQAIFKARKGLIYHILQLPIIDYSEWASGDLLSRVSGDTSKLRVGIIQLSVSITSGLFLVGGAIIGLMIKDLYLFLITLITIVISFLFIMFMTNLIQKSSYEAQKSLGVLSSIINRCLYGIRTIRSANETDTEIKKATSEAEQIKQLGLKLAKYQSIMTPISNLGLQICGLIVIGVGGYRVSNGSMTIGSLTSFILLLYIAISPMQQIFSAMSSVADSLGAMGRIKEITDLPLENQYDIGNDSSIKKLENTKEFIAFKNVTFSYDKYSLDESEENIDFEPVLRGLSFTIKKGECISIVGPSGAGKSTILQLLERFYEPNNGKIFLDGMDFTFMTREEVREKIVYVEQNAPLIYGTIYENLALGNKNTSKEFCKCALEKVNLSYLLDRNSLGLDALVGENGIGLSGGERQRLAMARVILSDSDIVLLDELTSNLDSINEKILKDVIKELRGKKTIIMVAHRLSTIMESDVIYVLEHGRIVGSGTHNELLKSIPLYKELAKEQMLS